jgi:hypothetical protein
MFRNLASIALFAKERAEKSIWARVRSKQGDAEEIKRCEKDLKRAFELFNVRVQSWTEPYAYAYNINRSAPRWTSRYTLT